MLRFFVISLWVLLSGCAWSKSVSPDKYISKVNEVQDKLVQTKHSGVGTYTLRLVPGALRVIQLYKNKHISATQAQEMLAESYNRYDFILQLEIPENGMREFMTFDNGRDSYEAKVKYFSFGFWDDIKYKSSNGTWVKVGAYNFERSFGLSPKGTMLFSVASSVAYKTLVIEIHDRIFGEAAIQFDFDLKYFKKLPKLERVSKWKIQN